MPRFRVIDNFSEPFDNKLGRQVERLQPARRQRFFNAVGNQLVAESMIAFNRRRWDGVPWVALSEATRSARRRGGFDPNRQLIRTGNLRASISFRATPDRVEAGSVLPYANIHWSGGWAGTGRKVKIPQRKYIGITRETRARVMSLAVRELSEGGGGVAGGR